MITAISIFLVLVSPLVFRYLEYKFSFIEKIGAVLLCYALGLIIGNQSFFVLDNKIIKEVSEVSLVIALPLLLFNLNFKKWWFQAPKAVLSFGLAALAAMLSAVWCATRRVFI